MIKANFDVLGPPQDVGGPIMGPRKLIYNVEKWSLSINLVQHEPNFPITFLTIPHFSQFWPFFFAPYTKLLVSAVHGPLQLAEQLYLSFLWQIHLIPSSTKLH